MDKHHNHSLFVGNLAAPTYDTGNTPVAISCPNQRGLPVVGGCCPFVAGNTYHCICK
ncbi:MAG: hypothetical protein WB612_08795 [Nitrososphaeraceae archaeon]